MNFLDKTIALINPSAAFRREQARAALDILQQRRFDGASRGRRTANLPVGDSSANTENATQLAMLRSRSRHFGRNNSYAKRAFKSIVNNTVGTGIVPAPMLSAKGRLKQVKSAWKAWAEKTECDFDGRLNFYGIQKLVMRTVAESGEVLIVRRRKNDGTLPIELQVLDPEYLDHSRDIQQLPNGGWIIQGVQFSPTGKREGYWLFKHHPYEMGHRESRMVPADEVIHVYEVVRPGQARGVPFIHSAMLRINDFDDYVDAELVKQKTAACFAAFVTGDEMEDADDDLERLEPGMIRKLPSGKSITFSNPPVHQNYESYNKGILREIAAGFDITYECMTGDLSNVNFSSGRMGWLEMQRQVQTWQWDMLIPQLCDGVWRWFTEAVQMKSGVMASDVDVTWTPPRREMIDPVKETQAITDQVRAGLITWQEAVREQGYEPDEQLQAISAWMKQLDEQQVKLDTDARNPAKGGGTPAADPAQQDGNQPPAKK